MARPYRKFVLDPCEQEVTSQTDRGSGPTVILSENSIHASSRGSAQAGRIPEETKTAPLSPKTKQPRLQTKISFGTVLTRINATSNRPEAVLVRGRYSHEYAEFVHGRYSRKNARAVAVLLNAMSVNERLDIYSLNFGQMWYRIWLTANCPELYNQKFAKFQASWLRDDSGEYLRRLIQASQPAPQGGEARWEFPKGRRRSDREPAINCAIRELQEETGVAKRDYQLLPGFRRQVSYVHMGVRYLNVYYVAVARRDLNVAVDFRTLGQATEISETRWMDIEQIRLVDTAGRRLESTVAPIFRYVKRYARGLIPQKNLPVDFSARTLRVPISPSNLPTKMVPRAETLYKRRRALDAKTLFSTKTASASRFTSTGLFPVAPARATRFPRVLASETANAPRHQSEPYGNKVPWISLETCSKTNRGRTRKITAPEGVEFAKSRRRGRPPPRR